MRCKKCGGRMYVDRLYEGSTKADIFCIMCGKRVFVSKSGNALGEWLAKLGVT